MSYTTARTEGIKGGPLFFTFHGTGGDENQFHALASQMLPGAQIVSPRGDVNENGMNRFFRRTGEGVYDMEDLRKRTEMMAEFLRSETAAAGFSRVVGMGYSNGANILASVALTHPEIVGDLVLMHPLIPWSPEPQSGLSGKRILGTAGRKDPICPAPETERFAAYLTEQGADLTLHWHGGGHEIRQEEIDAIQAFLG